MDQQHPGHLTTETHRVPTQKVATDRGTGGDVLVELMKAEGIEVAFGVVSIHNLPLVEAVDRDLRFVPVRHEAAAINAADAYGRVTGKFGIALTSTGSGAGNAAGACLESLNAHSRVLHITGNIDSQFLGEDQMVYHEVPRQLAMLEAVSRHALRVERAKNARRVLTRAVHLLAGPPHGPVSVDWPIDLQYTADPRRQSTVRSHAPERVEVKKRDVRAAVKLMVKAKRPLIWAGGGAKDVGPALTALADAWGAGVLTGASGRGVVPDGHPLHLGNFPLAPALTELIESADVLLTVGSHLRGNETSNFTLALPTKHIQIDVDAGTVGRSYPATVSVVADARSAVPALLEALDSTRVKDSWREQVAASGRAGRSDHRAQIGAYAAMVDSLNARLPKNSVVVRDVTIPGNSWGQRLVRIDAPTDNVYTAGGGIGQGLALAIGAGVARPQDVVLGIVGDGGLAVHLGELATLAEQKPNVILAVFNDGGYGILRHMQEAKDGPRRAVDILTPDLAALAAAYALPHVRVGDPAGFDEALGAAIERGGPGIIEIDVPALDPQPEPIIPAVEVP